MVIQNFKVALATNQPFNAQTTTGVSVSVAAGAHAERAVALVVTHKDNIVARSWSLALGAEMRAHGTGPFVVVRVPQDLDSPAQAAALRDAEQILDAITDRHVDVAIIEANAGAAGKTSAPLEGRLIQIGRTARQVAWVAGMTSYNEVQKATLVAPFTQALEVTSPTDAPRPGTFHGIVDHTLMRGEARRLFQALPPPGLVAAGKG